eukprot:g9090.t1
MPDSVVLSGGAAGSTARSSSASAYSGIPTENSGVPSRPSSQLRRQSSSGQLHGSQPGTARQKVTAGRGSRCTGFRTLQSVEDGLYLSYDLQKKQELGRERQIGSRSGPRQLFANRPPTTKQCAVVPRSNAPNSLKDGRFSFWRDVRGPFKVTGLAVLDDQSAEFKQLLEESESLRKVPLQELNEVYKLEWEGYLSYDVERNFTDIEDRRLYGIAVVKIPLGYSKGALKVFSWGKPSCFDKKLEFLFKPESKKFYGPTKGKLPPAAGQSALVAQ